MRPLRAALAAAIAAAALPASAQTTQPGAPALEPRAPPRLSQSPAPRAPYAGFALDRNLEIGIGRFGVQAPARLRSHVERERDPVDVGAPRRGIAAVGLRLSF